MDNISGHLRETLELRGMSLEELMERSGVSEDVLRNIETNSTDVNVSDLQKISNALNISFQIGNTTI
ncbi:helix-turn-helix domain-containing protein [Virgibacillus byunsanensis]|uniref:Helix-turn-helix domain-containing protein n=1 Tax=Virgibacillus byunsanensis TaxID=570945 RepID=A0ABW3LTC8_9BACI